MSEPVEPETKRRNHGRSHSYLLDGHKVPGVTTLLGKGFPKPGLNGWYAETVASKAIDEWDTLAALPISQRFKELKNAPNEARNSAGVRGTRVHKLAERLVAGELVEVPAELTGHVNACVRFLDKWDVQPILVERPVFNRTDQYAGSPDLVAALRDAQTWLLDYKTNANGPYGDVAFQLAAYRYAEFYLDEDNLEQPMPDIDEAGVVWLRPDGGYDLIPSESGPEVFRQFQYIAQTAQAAEMCRDYLGDPLIGADA